MTRRTSDIHIGIGGGTFAPWRGVFYPKGLAHAKELRYASERLTLIAIAKRKAAPRDVFADVIHDGKMRAPAGATALIAQLKIRH